MKHARSFFPHAWRTLALSVLLGAPLAAAADDFSDVTQLMRSARYGDALIRAEQYLVAKPRDPQMRFLKGVVQTEAGRTADAMVTFMRLTEDFPELPEPYNNLAVLYAGQSQFDKARVALEMAIRNNPNYATAHANLGDVYVKLASQSYAKSIQLEPGQTSVLQPKLVLIREIFAPGPAGAKPVVAPVSTSAPSPRRSTTPVRPASKE